MKYIWESAWIYPTLFISTVIIYTECVFFHGYYFNNYTFPSNLEVALKAVISAYSSDLTFGYILVLYFIVAFGFWAIRLRKSIILEPFNEDAEKDRKQESLGGHLHALLAYELNHILKLYCDVDNKRPISTSINVVPSPSVNAKVEDVSEIMGTVATNNITFGPLQIPVKVLLSFFGRLLGGKKIQGSLFFSKNEIIIVASMMGGDKSHNWKVQRSYPPKSTEEIQKMSDQPGGWTAEGILIREMIEELACQIFSDLTEFQSFRWDATKAFMKGIESYRECLLSPGNKIGNLKEAESAFSHALSLDVTFSSAWYNLGAVYTELKFRDAAKVAFYKSFSNNRIKGDAYYALALNEYNTYIEDPLYGTPAA
ncbi:MAG: hypothetical protein NTZ24_15245, partial [Deltaproteobacteria bacterium]|nr:hypothetical protein [Deltaproteobacteria bacterium]